MPRITFWACDYPLVGVDLSWILGCFFGVRVAIFFQSLLRLGRENLYRLPDRVYCNFLWSARFLTIYDLLAGHRYFANDLPPRYRCHFQALIPLYLATLLFHYLPCRPTLCNICLQWFKTSTQRPGWFRSCNRTPLLHWRWYLFVSDMVTPTLHFDSRAAEPPILYCGYDGVLLIGSPVCFPFSRFLLGISGRHLIGWRRMWWWGG